MMEKLLEVRLRLTVSGRSGSLAASSPTINVLGATQQVVRRKSTVKAAQKWLFGVQMMFLGGVVAVLGPDRSRWEETTRHVPIEHPYFPDFIGYFDLRPVEGGFADAL